MAFIDTFIAFLSRIFKWDLEPQEPVSPYVPQIATTSEPVVLSTPNPAIMPEEPAPVNPDSISYPWDTQKHNYHNVRVLCDEAGLTADEKNIICACIYQESAFRNSALNYNKNSSGKVMSTDYGIAQINDFYHIGPSKDFPSVDYVLKNPDKVVEWMISMYKHGMLKQWVSYSSGAYRHWLIPSSPMWALKS